MMLCRIIEGLIIEIFADEQSPRSVFWSVCWEILHILRTPILIKESALRFKKGDVRSMRNSRFLWVTMIACKTTGLLRYCLSYWPRVNLPRKINMPFAHLSQFRGKEFVRRIAPDYATLRFMPRAVRIVAQYGGPEAGPTDTITRKHELARRTVNCRLQNPPTHRAVVRSRRTVNRDATRRDATRVCPQSLTRHWNLRDVRALYKSPDTLLTSFLSVVSGKGSTFIDDFFSIFNIFIICHTWSLI